LLIIRAGTPNSCARAFTCFFNKPPIGNISTPPSPYLVKYPTASSDLLPVPHTR